MRYLLLLALCFAIACSSTEKGGTIVLVTGGEPAAEVFEGVTELQVDTIAQDGGVTTLAKVPMPAAELVDLADVDPESIGALRVRGVDPAGTILARGTSVPVYFGALRGASIDLFVQRSGTFARLPSSLADVRTSPLVESVAGRYVFVAGGEPRELGATAQIYDLATYEALAAPPSLPRAPSSIAVVGTSVLLVNGEGATWFDLSSSAQSEATAPTGGRFDEVAGGRTVKLADGSSYIVGGTRRSGDPTERVLRVGADGALSFASLVSKRKGAAAVWVEGRGLVVIGGAAEPSSGVEVLAPGADTAAPLAYPADETAGAAAVAVDPTSVVRVGGLDVDGKDAGIRRIDLACAAACAPMPWGVDLPEALASAQAFMLGPNDLLVAGDRPDGDTRAFRVSTNGATEVPLKVARHGARAVVLPTEGVGLVGGAHEIESIVP